MYFLVGLNVETAIDFSLYLAMKRCVQGRAVENATVSDSLVKITAEKMVMRKQYLRLFMQQFQFMNHCNFQKIIESRKSLAGTSIKG